MAEVINGILIREVETKNIMTKSSLPVGGYSVNPYVGCTHACKYCYASFMKRFTGHKEEWGAFLDVKHWPEIKNPKKYAGQRVVIGSVTDGYNPQEEQFGNTRKLLEQLIGSDADILICTKSDLVVRDIDLLKKLGRVTVSWSINTLDENFKNDMDSVSSIEHRVPADEALEIVDTTGCGDSYHAGFVCSHMLIGDIYEAMRVGTEFATETLSHYGGF